MASRQKILGIVVGAIAAGFLTHGMASSGMDLGTAAQHSFWTYRGSFARVILSIWHLWASVHGLGQISLFHARVEDISTFGRFLARAIFIGSPLAGFSVFALCSGQRIDGRSWRPLAMAILLGSWDSFHHFLRKAFWFNVDFGEAAVAVIVTLLMIWGLSSLRIWTPRSLLPTYSPSNP